MQYGRVHTIRTLDDEGSTIVEESTVVNYEETDTKRHYEMRIRVTTEKEELEQFLQFRTRTKEMTKAAFLIEHTAIGNKDGFWYVILCWTEK